jgi:hypothetical protein
MAAHARVGIGSNHDQALPFNAFFDDVDVRTVRRIWP